MELAPGAEVDRYAVEALLGEGGMAVVYRVRHRTLGSLHALKVLTVTNPKLRDRLIREGRVQATLQHPNVVGVTDIIDVRGAPGLIMQFVDGPSLESWLEQGIPELPEAERIFFGILDAVEAAHAVGVIHRDLKPANVLLAGTPGGFVPRVADFGIARALSEGEVMRATRTGAAMGTPSFMAPEQIRDARNVDHRADVFSLGCILYEMVTGTPAFRGESVLDLFEAISGGQFRPPEELVPSLPVGLSAAIRGALVADRDRRIPDCATLRAVIRGERGWEVGEVPAHRTMSNGSPGVPPLSRSKPPLQTLPPSQPTGRANATMSFDDAVADDPITTLPASRAGWLRTALLICVVALSVGAYGWWTNAGKAPPPPDIGPIEDAPPAGSDTMQVGGGTSPATDGLQTGIGGTADPTSPTLGDAGSTGVGAEATGGASDPPPGGTGGKGGARGGRGSAAAGNNRDGAGPNSKSATVTADASGIRLVNSTGEKFPLGVVPAGRYSIEWTQNGIAGGAGEIAVMEGERVSLHCSHDFVSCDRAN